MINRIMVMLNEFQKDKMVDIDFATKHQIAKFTVMQIVCLHVANIFYEISHLYNSKNGNK